MKKIILLILFTFTLLFTTTLKTKAFTQYDELNISAQEHLSYYWTGQEDAYIVMSNLLYNADALITFELYINDTIENKDTLPISDLILGNALEHVDDPSTLLTTWYGTSEILLINTDITILKITDTYFFDYDYMTDLNEDSFYYLLSYNNQLSRIGYFGSSINTTWYYSTEIITLFNSYYTVYTQAYNYGTSTLNTDVEKAYKNGYEQGQAYSDGYYINLLTLKTNDFNEILKAKQQEYYNIGHNAGYNLAQSEELGWSSIFSTFFQVFNILNIKILNDITLGHILAVPLLLGLLSFIIGVATASIRKKE